MDDRSTPPSGCRRGGGDLPDDVIADILLRLPPPPDHHLLQCAAVSRAFHRVVSEDAFRREFLARHPTPPFLGFILRNSRAPRPSVHAYPGLPPALRRGVTTAAAAFDFLPSIGDIFVAEVRHGRALVRVDHPDMDLIVCRPLAKTWRAVPSPPLEGRPCYHALAFLPSGSSAFRVAALLSTTFSRPSHFRLCVFSSASNSWAVAEVAASFLDPASSFLIGPSVVVDGIWYSLHKDWFIVAVDAATMQVSKIDLPIIDDAGVDEDGESPYLRRTPILGTTEGPTPRLRLFTVERRSLRQWERNDVVGGDQGLSAWAAPVDIHWQPRLFPALFAVIPRRIAFQGAFAYPSLRLLGFGESTGVLLLQLADAVVAFEVKTRRAHTLSRVATAAAGAFVFDMDWPPLPPPIPGAMGPA